MYVLLEFLMLWGGIKDQLRVQVLTWFSPYHFHIWLLYTS